jgi:hypothetical protein
MVSNFNENLLKEVLKNKDLYNKKVEVTTALIPPLFVGTVMWDSHLDPFASEGARTMYILHWFTYEEKNPHDLAIAYYGVSKRDSLWCQCSAKELQDQLKLLNDPIMVLLYGR